MQVQRVKECLRYDPSVGGSCLVWTTNRRHRKLTGTRAGTVNAQGYWVVKLDQKYCMAHRIIWALNTGNFPEQELDHVDGDPGNNILSNLRECTHAENQQNKSAPKERGSMGTFKRGNKFGSQIKIKGKKHFLGYYATVEEAHATYISAKAKLHTFNPTVRGYDLPTPNDTK